MFSYDYLLLLSIAFFAIISSSSNFKTQCNVLGNQVERFNLIFAFIIFSPILLVVTFNQLKTGDITAYLTNYYRSTTNFSDIINDWSFEKNGQGFQLIVVFIKKIFGYNPEVYKFIIGLIQAIPVVIILRLYSENYIYSVFLFIATGCYSGWMMNGIRQFTAVCIVFLCIPFVLKKSYIPVIILIFIAFTIHQTAIIMIPILLVSKLNPWKKTTLFIIIILSVALYLYIENSGLISEELSLSDDGANPLRVVFSSLPIILVIIGYKKLKEDKNALSDICVNMSFITTSIYFIAMLTSGILTGRLPIYTEMYSFVLIPYVLNKIFEEQDRKIAYMILSVIYLAYFFVMK